MSQKMIRVSESAYWALKQTAAAGRLSMAEVVDRLVAFTGGGPPAPSVSSEPPPAVPGGTWVARCPGSWDVGSVRSRCDLPAGHAGACDAGVKLTVREVLAQIPDAPSPPGVAALPAEVRAKAWTGPFSKAAQMGKKS